MPTPEQFNVAFEREKQGILDAIERAKEVNAAVLASLAKGKKRIKGMKMSKRMGKKMGKKMSKRRRRH
jgi:hypothetical protein